VENCFGKCWVENGTAVLQWLYVEIDRGVEHIVLQFSGTFDGEPRKLVQ